MSLKNSKQNLKCLATKFNYYYIEIYLTAYLLDFSYEVTRNLVRHLNVCGCF